MAVTHSTSLTASLTDKTCFTLSFSEKWHLCSQRNASHTPRTLSQEIPNTLESLHGAELVEPRTSPSSQRGRGASSFQYRFLSDEQRCDDPKKKKNHGEKKTTTTTTKQTKTKQNKKTKNKHKKHPVFAVQYHLTSHTCCCAREIIRSGPVPMTVGQDGTVILRLLPLHQEPEGSIFLVGRRSLLCHSIYDTFTCIAKDRIQTLLGSVGDDLGKH